MPVGIVSESLARYRWKQPADHLWTPPDRQVPGALACAQQDRRRRGPEVACPGKSARAGAQGSSMPGGADSASGTIGGAALRLLGVTAIDQGWRFAAS